MNGGQQDAAQFRTLASVIGIGEDGIPFLRGHRCSGCQEVLVGTHRACPNCYRQATLEPIRLATRGRLYAYTIVHRSFPGVETPVVSAIAALDGGGYLRGNLVGIDPDPERIEFDMRIAVRFERIKREEGTTLLRYLFVPEDKEMHRDE